MAFSLRGAVAPSRRYSSRFAQIASVIRNGRASARRQHALRPWLDSMEARTLLAAGILNFSAVSYVVSENAVSIHIDVVRTGGSDGAVDVQIDTSDGTAHAGTSYTAVHGGLSYDAGQTLSGFTLTVANDHIARDDITVNLALSNPTGGAILGTPSTAIVTITDAPSSGDLDGSFGVEGRWVDPAGAALGTGTHMALGTVSQADGKLLIGGYTDNFQFRFFLERHNADGTLDTSFGTGGVLQSPVLRDDGYTRPNGFAINPSDGKIVLSTSDLGFNGFIRLNPNLTLDTGFGTNGFVSTPGLEARGPISVLANGKILLQGFDTLSPGVVEWALVGFTASGVRDVGFGDNSRIMLGNVTMFPLSDGKFLLGYSVGEGEDRRCLVERRNSNGSLDTSFGVGGTATGTGGIPGGFAFQPDGKIIAYGNGGPWIGGYFMTRFTAAGQLDTSFGDNGDVKVYIPGYTYYGSAQRLSFQADGKIVMVGDAVLTDPVRRPSAILRFDANGHLDPSFGTGGWAVVPNGPDQTTPPRGMIIAPDGKVVVLTNMSLAGEDDWRHYALARLINPPAAQAPGQLQWSVTTAQVNEGDGTVTLTVTRTGGSDGSVAVHYATSDGSAHAGTDFTTTAGNLTFAPGEISKTITVPIVDDAQYEPGETFSVVLSAATGGATLGTPTTATVTILDDDPILAGQFQFSAATASIDEGNAVTLTVTRTNGSAGAVTIHFVTTNGTGTAGVDYVPMTGTLIFLPGEASKLIVVQSLDDNRVAGNKTFGVILSAPGMGATLGVPSSATVTVVDGVPGRLQFSVSTAAVKEGQVATLIVTRTGGSAGFVSVHYATANATGRAGVNYVKAVGDLTLQSGETSKAIAIATRNDGRVAGNKTFRVVLSAPKGGATLGSPNTSTVTVVDTQPGRFQFSTSTAVVNEGQIVILTVTRTRGSDGLVTVRYATSNSTAKAGVNYDAAIGTLTFQPGETVKTIAIATRDDGRVAGSKTFRLTLSKPTKGASLGAPSAVKVSILDSKKTSPSIVAKAAFMVDTLLSQGALVGAFGGR